jgi:excisionase family DNA binding protein
MAVSEWLSTEEAAAEIGVTPQSVRRYIAAGKLKARALVIGQRATYRIRAADLQAFLDAYTMDAETHVADRE